MNLSAPFIKRPIATSLIMAGIALFGVIAYQSLPVSDLPNVDFPTLLVTASTTLPMTDFSFSSSSIMPSSWFQGRLPDSGVEECAKGPKTRVQGPF